MYNGCLLLASWLNIKELAWFKNYADPVAGDSNIN